VPAVKGAGWAELILLVGSITLGISSLRHSIQPMIPATAPETLTETVESGPLPRLIERLDPDLRGKLQSISVRDHYVDVSTSLGVGSLLMRFSDAISEVWPVEGAQVHRSHWVAWDAVEAVEREGGKLFLRLPSGARIPVSRNHRDKLEARGLV
jgi:DNA-binding LytR/AlgR family response regulator